MSRRYLSKNYKGLGSAGNKAKTDIETILEKLGYKNAGLKQTSYNSKVLGFLITLLGVLKVPFSLKRGDVLVLQYPLKKYFAFVCNMAHMRGCKVVTIIHDLGTFRRRKLTIEQEIKRLDHSDYIIAHNKSMKEWLINNGIRAMVGELEIFDYLSTVEAPSQKVVSLPYSVVYAGALTRKKNAFLYELDKYISDYRFSLYGGGFDLNEIQNKEYFTYNGFVPSDELIKNINGDFGLVWDGDSIVTCIGSCGEYLALNNPHKTSLYIRCMIPIIIWDKAALAPFVKENGIGICIDSLKNLDKVLSEISAEEYQEMRKNITVIKDRISSGYYAGKAIEEAYKVLTE
ncbi:MAG: galactofuranosyltransferase, partial [Prevotella sp.]|nr:galactofuranosyltransferase [Prevotella sp.]